jgi:hypothetical protein
VDSNLGNPAFVRVRDSLDRVMRGVDLTLRAAKPVCAGRQMFAASVWHPGTRPNNFLARAVQ